MFAPRLKREKLDWNRSARNARVGRRNRSLPLAHLFAAAMGQVPRPLLAAQAQGQGVVNVCAGQLSSHWRADLPETKSAN